MSNCHQYLNDWCYMALLQDIIPRDSAFVCSAKLMRKLPKNNVLIRLVMKSCIKQRYFKPDVLGFLGQIQENDRPLWYNFCGRIHLLWARFFDGTRVGEIMPENLSRKSHMSKNSSGNISQNSSSHGLNRRCKWQFFIRGWVCQQASVLRATRPKTASNFYDIVEGTWVLQCIANENERTGGQTDAYNRLKNRNGRTYELNVHSVHTCTHKRLKK